MKMLRLENLSVRSKDSVDLLKNISLDIKKGKPIGLTGASGAGKTTLLKSIMGVHVSQLEVSQGRILLDGRPLNKMSLKERRRICGTCIGYIPQNPMTAFNPRKRVGCQIVETLMVRQSCSKKDAVEKFANQITSLNLKADWRLLRCYPHEVSGGMLQRIALALVLCLEPDYLLADEPTSALDSENKQCLVEMLKGIENKVGLLLVSHDGEVLRALCDEVLFLDKGRLVNNELWQEFLTQPEEERVFVWRDY
jgi:ABC-type glutathione transport system ATPase component